MHRKDGNKLDSAIWDKTKTTETDTLVTAQDLVSSDWFTTIDC